MHFSLPLALPSYLFRITSISIEENNSPYSCFDDTVLLLDSIFADVHYTLRAFLPSLLTRSESVLLSILEWNVLCDSFSRL